MRERGTIKGVSVSLYTPTTMISIHLYLSVLLSLFFPFSIVSFTLLHSLFQMWHAFLMMMVMMMMMVMAVAIVNAETRRNGDNFSDGIGDSNGGEEGKFS